MNFTWSFITVIVYILTETDAIYEYARLLRIPLPLGKDYAAAKNSGGSDNYFDHLAVFKNSFLIRMVTCPTCITVVLSIALTACQHFFGTLPSGIIETFGVNTLGAWLAFRLLKALDKQVNE